MIRSLKQTVLAITSATNLPQAMSILVSHVLQQVKSDRVSFFLLEPKTGDLVLVASTQKDKIPVGKWRVKRGQGLLAQVVSRAEPLNLPDSSLQEQSVKLPIDDLYNQVFKGYLGVKVTHQGQLLGVIVVERSAVGVFSEGQEALLMTMTAQLANSVARALDNDKIFKAMKSFASGASLSLKGRPVSPGVAMGEVVVVYPPADFDSISDKPAEDIAEELEALYSAITKVGQDIERMKDRLEESLSQEDLAIFGAYQQILSGQSFTQAVVKKVKGGQWVQSALKSVVLSYAQSFEQMEDEYLQERSSDIKDIGRRVLAHIQSQGSGPFLFPEKTVLISQDVTPSMIAEIPRGHLMAIVSLKGTPNSHAAILAKALNIPAVMGLDALPLSQLDNKLAIVDGYVGHVVIEPTDTVKASYTQLANEETELKSSLKSLASMPAVTTDDHEVNLQANTGLVADIDQAYDHGAMGIGLFRSEIPFMTLDRFPSEEEQRLIYRQHLQAFPKYPVTMRVLDIGGDKVLPYFNISEENPFLGWRGIRVMLDHPELFLIQIRAMLEASLGLNNLQIMLPMVSGIEEIQKSKRLINQAYYELVEDGKPIEMPKVGVMIEVPAAVRQIEEILKQVDFVSIGSNDLIQYLLAVDRNNPRVTHLFDAFHPAVIQAICDIADAAVAANKPVGLCGELGGNPMAVLLFIGMGIHSISMNAASLLKVKWVIRGFTRARCRQILYQVKQIKSSKAIYKLLESELISAGFGGLIRAGKD